jgi:hypothetical protein
VIHNNAPQHPTTSQHHNITANKMSDWSFVNKFAEGIANRVGVTTDSVWEAMLSGRPPIGSEEGGPKDKFTEEEVHGFSERLKNWILEHPKEVAKLVACIGAAPTAVAVAPALLGMVGFGPLGPVVGKRCPTQIRVQND